ncbi:hypothetical protein V8B55DRAFT_1013639 [Mucor lusitanicus]
MSVYCLLTNLLINVCVCFAVCTAFLEPLKLTCYKMFIMDCIFRLFLSFQLFLLFPFFFSIALPNVSKVVLRGTIHGNKTSLPDNDKYSSAALTLSRSSW